MPITSALDASDVLIFGQALLEKLEQAQTRIGGQAELGDEKRWLSQALERLDSQLGPTREALRRARALPELVDIRDELAAEHQNAWVDALEKLLAGVTFHASSRAPIIEALFPHQKFATLRRATSDAVSAYAAEFERRASSSYVTRMMAQDDYGFLRPVLDEVRKQYAEWQQTFDAPKPSAEAAAKLVEAIVTSANALDLAIRQSRALAEAALCPLEGVAEALGLFAKMKKRAAKTEGAAVVAVSREIVVEGEQTQA
jgi:hypothetical protein